MTQGAQGVHHSSGATPIWAKAQERKDVDASSAYHHELRTGNAFDFAKKHPEIQASLTGGASIW